MRFKIALFCLLAFAIMANGQDKLPAQYTIKSSSVSLGLLGSPSWPLGFSYSQMITKRFSFEMGAGIFAVGAGLNIYITNPEFNRFNLYTGLSGMINFDGFPMIYLPVGVSYFSKSNFQYSLDVGAMSSANVSLSGNGANPSPWFGLKVGYRFGEDLATLKERERTPLKNILSINLGWYDIFAGVIYERLVTPFLGLEAGIGFLGASIGSKLYFPSISPGHLNFHVGVSPSWGFDFWNGSSGVKTYFPIGINILTKKNFRYSLDAGPQYWFQDNETSLSLSLRVGKAF